MWKRNDTIDNNDEKKTQKKYKTIKKYKKYNKLKNNNIEKENENEINNKNNTYTQDDSSSEYEESMTIKNTQKDDFKTLPCENFIRDGCCVYKKKCKYIHDIRLEIICQKTPIKGINKDFQKRDKDILKNSFFYDKVSPVLDQHEVYEPKFDINYLNHRRLDVFKHLGNGKSISNYENNHNYYNLKNNYTDNQKIRYDYQKGFILYRNLIEYLS